MRSSKRSWPNAAVLTLAVLDDVDVILSMLAAGG